MAHDEPDPKEYSVSIDTARAGADKPADAATATDPNGVPTGSWAADFCGCIDTCVPNGLMAFLCPCISVGQICERLGLVPYMHVVAAFAVAYVASFLAWVTGWLLFQFIAMLVCIMLALGVTRLRFTMRRLFAIPGEVWADLVLAFVCGPCTIAQMATHVSAYSPGSCDFRPRETLPGYTW